MKTIDMRFEQSMIQDWIGKKFNMYKCDAFDFTNSVTQIVGLYIGEEVFALTNMQETVDYFGNTEDISVSKLKKSEDGFIRSAFKDAEMISSPVDEEISSVKVVNELQKISVNGTSTYEVWLTRAIIIEAGGREISFEKDNVPFSEEIIIRRGYNLVDKIADNDDFLEGWDDEYTSDYSREVIEIK